MSLAGEGAVAIWHDVVPEGREEFYAWHGEQHMPERVGIPGFLRGRRYIATRANPEYFNLYEALSPQVVAGTDYLNRLNNPTPWTVSTVKHFRNVSRSVCSVAYTTGRGNGGHIVTLRYDLPDGNDRDHLVAMRERLLPGLAGHRGVAGVHLLVADTSASAVKTEEQKVRTEKNLVPVWSLLLEGWGDEAEFEKFCDSALLNGLKEAGADDTSAIVGYYRLQSTRCRTSTAAG